jgi:glycosyltransferase involved in cell wall biosynthesis
MAKSKKKAKVEEDEPDSSKLQEEFEEEIKKPYYDVFYLDNFKLPYEKLDVSAVIITRNRCPHKPGTLKEGQNPLLWAFKTVLYQRPQIKELILVDDNSDDNTFECAKVFEKEAKEKGVKFIYIKNLSRLGPGIARNVGAKKVSSKYIWFIDDDAFFAPYSAFGAIYTFEELKKNGIQVGVINLPTYSRTSVPTSVVEKSLIGSISFLKGTHTSNKDAFPEEYLEFKGDKKFIDSELNILRPFSIMNVNAICVCSKSAFEDVGGFSEQAIKRMEDRDFGCRLIDNGYHAYFSPDPKFHCVHGSYGLKTGVKFEGNDWFKKIDKSISIKKAMDICDSPKDNNGARIDPQEYIYQSILSFFTLAYFRNKKGAVNWIKRVYNEFVIKGETSVFGNPGLPSPDESKRKEMWINAINEGLDFVKNKEEVDINHINKIVKKLHSEKHGPGEKVLSLVDDI